MFGTLPFVEAVLWMVDHVCVYIPDLCSFLPVFFCFIVFLTRLHVPDTVVASGIGYMSSFVTCSRHVRDRCDAMVMQKCIHV